jgi:hypothetical protein
MPKLNIAKDHGRTFQNHLHGNGLADTWRTSNHECHRSRAHLGDRL